MRFRRGFRRRNRAAWAHAGAFTLSVTAATPVSFVWLMPPARSEFLMDTDRKDRLGYRGSLLWMDFWWTMPAESMTPFDLPNTVLYAIVSQSDSSGAPQLAAAPVDPFGEPKAPGTIGSWDGDPETEGTDAFLWSHYIKGFSPPNAIVNVRNTGVMQGADNFGNQTTRFDGSTSGTQINYACRKFYVAAEWQPDVQIKSRRTLRHDEGVALVIVSDVTTPNPIVSNLDVRFRTLVNRGR